MRREYELTAGQYADLLEASKPVPYMVFDGQEPPSQQANANRAWAALGAALGFDSMTVEPSEKGEMFFTALPTIPPAGWDKIEGDHA